MEVTEVYGVKIMKNKSKTLRTEWSSLPQLENLWVWALDRLNNDEKINDSIFERDTDRLGGVFV